MTNFVSKIFTAAMRIFQILCRSRKPQDPNKVPLARPRLYFALRDRVCTKKVKGGLAPALQEMQNLITKLSQNDYNQTFCQKEVVEMRDANTASYNQFLKEKEENRAGRIKPGSHLNPVPLNKYLKQFPIVKPNPYEEKICDYSKYKHKYSS